MGRELNEIVEQLNENEKLDNYQYIKLQNICRDVFRLPQAHQLVHDADFFSRMVANRAARRLILDNLQRDLDERRRDNEAAALERRAEQRERVAARSQIWIAAVEARIQATEEQLADDARRTQQAKQRLEEARARLRAEQAKLEEVQLATHEAFKSGSEVVQQTIAARNKKESRDRWGRAVLPVPVPGTALPAWAAQTIKKKKPLPSLKRPRPDRSGPREESGESEDDFEAFLGRNKVARAVDTETAPVPLRAVELDN